jgi:CRISPR type IV-associated protein Csf3
MKPIRIDFDLASPVIEPTYPMHLDGLLAWAAVDEAIEAGVERPLATQESLPLASQNGVWCASAVLFDYSNSAETVAMVKRTDPLAISDALVSGVLKKAPNKLNLQSGPWRQALFFSQCRHARVATAYCVGDKQRVESLLERVRYLGAKRRLGFGRVQSITVVDDETAREGWKKRVLSHQEQGYVPIQAVTSPPYWERARADTAWAHPEIV